MVVRKIVENRETKKRFYAEIDGYIEDENDIYSRIFKPVKISIYHKEPETGFIKIIKIIKYESYNDFEKEWRVIKFIRKFNIKRFQNYLEYEKRRYI